MPMFALAERGNSPVRHRRVPRTGPRISGALAALAAGLALTLAAGTAHAQSLTLDPNVVDEQSTVSITAALTGATANSTYDVKNSGGSSGCGSLFNFAEQRGTTDGSGNLAVTLSGTTGSVTSDQTCDILAQGPTDATASLTIRNVPAPPAPAAPTVSAVPLQPDRLAVNWTAPGGATMTDYDVRYYRGSADPVNEADWIEAGETGGHDHAGTLTQATITGLDPVATYRVQVRATTVGGTGKWSASGSGRTEGASGAWGSSVLELVGNAGESAAGGSAPGRDVAQGFTTSDRHALGYTFTDVDLKFLTVPYSNVQVRLATGVSTTNAGTTVATLRNPAALTAGVNTFTAPPGTTLDADTTYYVVVEASGGTLLWTNFTGSPSGLLDWSIDDRFTRTSGGWTSASGKTLIRINGREKVGDPPGKPGAPTLAAVTGSTNVTATLTAPTHTGSGITDYDLRYYEGSADPTDEADWVEEDETSGLPYVGTPDASTSVTITGLKASADYRVQVRAESHGAPGPWSDSASVTTNAPTGTNNAPTRAKLGTTAQGCIADDKNISWGTVTQASTGTLQSWTGFTGTGDCGAVTERRYPMFIDADGDTLTLTVEAVIPDNVRLVNGTPFFNKISNTDRLFTRGIAAGAPTDVRFNVTAVDPHGASAEGFFFVKIPTISTTSNNNEVPRFDQMVGTRGFQRNVPIPRWVLPPANGGETISRNGTGQLPYFYAVTGLPPGLAFDPMTRAITGTPTKDGTYTVTYTADDGDDRYSLKDSPTADDLADVARQSIVVQVGAPSIELVQIVSAPTYNSGAGNGFDTYIAGDTILVDVQFTEAVKVTGTPTIASAKTRVLLDLNGENKFANLLEDGGVLYGGRRLRFGYTVTASDTDTDGVFVKPKNSNNVVLLVPTGLNVTAVKSGAAALTTFDGLPTSGDANAKVDGSKSSDDIGPRPVSAATDNDGDTLTVTFSRALNSQVDLSGTPLEAYFSVQGAGVVGSGRRGTYQHPNSVTVSGKTLVMELNTPAQPGDTVTLSYDNIGGGAWPLKDQSSTPKRVAGFTDLAVTNNTGMLTTTAVSGLVGNLGKAQYSTSASLSSIDLAQGFTTGSNAAGYVLDAVVVDMGFAADSVSSALSVHLATGVSTASAGKTVATLTNPATVASGENRFTAPAGTTLSADTQYFVVFQSSDSNVNIRRTASKAEDAGAAAGWSIADDAHARPKASTGGFPTTATDAVLKMRIDGAEFVPTTWTGAGVGNLGQADYSSTANLASIDLAQGFTTGSNANGYALDAVVLDFATAPSGLTVQLATGVSTSSGGTTFATLTSPATLAAGENRFTAPAGTVLSAATQYFVVVQGSSGTVRRTASKAEDADAAAGWSIADRTYFRNASNTGKFQTDTAYVHKIGVDASGIPAASVQNLANLVGNLGKADYSSQANLSQIDVAQAFTTGSNDYILDAVVLDFATAPSGPTVQLATGVSTTSAGTTVATLTSPATLAAGELRFTAPANTVLSADTHYFVVVQGSSGTVRRTASKDEDAGAAAGWSIADRTYFRNASDAGRFQGNTSYVHKIRVDGYTGRLSSPPAPARASAVGTALELVFDRRLDQDSRPPGSAFTVRATDVDDSVRTIAGTGSAVVIDDATVTVTLTAAVKEGELLGVSYAKPAASPLRAAAGSPDVLSFESFHVEGVHDSTPPKLVGVVYVNKPTNNSQSKWTLYYDEALDPGSVPAAADFTVASQGTSLGISSPAVSNNAVTFTVVGSAPVMQFSYTPPATGGIRDLAGNPAAKIDGTTYSKTTAGKPTLFSARVEGTTMYVLVTKALDPASVPAASAFTLHYPDAASTAYPNSVETVQLESKNIKLNLVSPVHPCDGLTPFRVKYTKPTGAGDAKLQGLAGAETDTFGPTARTSVRNERNDQCVTRSVSGGRSGGQVPVWEQKSVTLKFDRSLDRTKTLDAADFTVEVPGASGSSAPSVRGASHTADGTGVKLALSRARNAGETATVGYTFPRSGQGLWDTDGNQFDSFSGVEVKDAGDPAALTASFHGLPDAHDGSRLFGFEIRFSEEFQGMRLTALKRALSVTGGRLVDMKRTVRGENRSVTVRVRPSQTGSLALALPAATDCSAADAVCAADGRKLSAAVSASVPGPDTPAALPVLSVADARANEGGHLRFAVTLSEAATGEVTVDYATADGSAGAGADYTAASGTLTFAAGETSKTVSVALAADRAAEGDETLTLTLSNASGATIGTAAATGTVVNAAPLPLLSVADARGDEGETLAFRVTLSEAATGDVTVDYATADYSAAAGEDYAATSGTLAFAAGETEKTVSVALLHDGSVDDGETFTLTLSNPSGAVIGDGEATGTVVDVPPLTATFHGLPEEHDGKRLFAFEIRFSEEFRGLELSAFRAGALQVTNGRVIDAKRKVRGENRSVTVRVRPTSFDEVRLTLPATTDCSAASAICTHDGRKLSGTVSATVRGPVTVSVADAEAREGTDAAIGFAVTLNRAASGEVTVNYATRDGTAKAGEDYTATRGTLTFAVGELEKTVSVPILDDALDEGAETFTLKLTGARGASIDDGEATGTIENSDPLQTMWLSRFGRTVADHVTGAVSDRLSNPLTGAQVTVGGQNLDIARMEDEAWLDRTMVSMARVLGVPEGSVQEDDSWPDTGLGMHDPTFGSAPVRSITGRELLLGSSFHLAGDGEGGGTGMTAWGRVTTGGFDGEAPADGGTVRVDGEVTTGILGTDAKWGRVLAGVALSVSEGEGSFDQPGVDSGTIESTMTTGSPYARIDLNDRITAWGMAGLGTGDMTIVQNANTTTNQPERITRTDLSLRMAAVGGRGALMTSGESGGMDLALRADAFLVQTESEAVSGEGNTKADASRMRLILEGSRAFRTDSGVLTPGLELGLRHDGGDAETGTGIELGGRISYANPETGLSLEANVRALVAHEDSNYEEWGASGALRLVPGARGRGLSFSLAPTYGAPGSGVEQLWSARDAGGLVQGGNTFDPESRIEGEIGYGLPAFGDRYTGTPNIGFGLADGGAREYRLGWRLARAGESSSGSFALSLDATRSEPVNNNDSGSGTAPKNAVVLRAGLRW